MRVNKADVEAYIRSLDLPYTFIQPGYYRANFTDLQFIKKGQDSVYTFAVPINATAPIPLFDAGGDMG